MKIITSPGLMNVVSCRLVRSGKSIGFVPTMGAFHEGHLSLIRRAKKENDIAVASIFVNPAQFLKGEDYKTYPRKIKQDKAMAAKAGCDILFCPGEKTIYKKDFSTRVEVQGLSDIMCGKARPGHFKGVALICLKLFNIVVAEKAYFGQKDYQQAVVVKKMARDLDLNVKIKVLPIIRESSGLAMSSRNSYLSLAEKDTAAFIYKSLKDASRAVREGEKCPASIISGITGTLKKHDMIIDYVEIVDPASLARLDRIQGKALIAVAVKIGKTRLIDNIFVNRNS